MRRLLVLTGVAGAILAQELPSPQIDLVVANQQFIDGPVWSPENYLLFAEVPSQRILKAAADGTTVFHEKSGGATGLALDDKGRLYACETGARRVTRSDRKGKVEVLAERFDGKRLNAPNDVVVSKSGHVYFTDPAFGKQVDARELDFYGVYHITPKLELSAVSKFATRPGGIALSPKGDKLYVSNSDEHNVRVYDVSKDGVPTNERVLVKDTEGVPAGIEVDDHGRIYVASGQLMIYSAEGKLLLRVKIGEKPSNLTFADSSTMYVTARGSVFRLTWPSSKGAQTHQP